MMFSVFIPILLHRVFSKDLKACKASEFQPALLASSHNCSNIAHYHEWCQKLCKLSSHIGKTIANICNIITLLCMFTNNYHATDIKTMEKV